MNARQSHNLNVQLDRIPIHVNQRAYSSNDAERTTKKYTLNGKISALKKSLGKDLPRIPRRSRAAQTPRAPILPLVAL